MRQKFYFALTLLSCLLALRALLVIWKLDGRIFAPASVSFTSPEGERLSGTFYPRMDTTGGILLLEGFGSDQVALRSAVQVFEAAGLAVFTFDFSGHGNSPGGLGFDNAATDRLVWQVLAAKEEFKRQSGLKDDQIIVAGHSLGGRVALQAARLDPAPPLGLILIGPQINLVPNRQSETFTGVTDAQLPWVQSLGMDDPRVEVLVISGAWDDILTPIAASRLMEKLCDFSEGEMMPEKDEDDRLCIQIDGPAYAMKRWTLFDGLLHNYEIYSPRVLQAAADWALRRFTSSPASSHQADSALQRINYLLAGLAGLFLALIGAERWVTSWKDLRTTEAKPASVPSPLTPAITHLRSFLWARLLLWLAALPLAVGLASLFFFIPLPVPVFNLIYGSFIGAYGVLLFALWAKGRMPGAIGKLPFANPNLTQVDRLGLGLVVMAALLVYACLYARTGWFQAPPTGARLLWIALFAPLTALSFWVGHYDAALVQQAAPVRSAPQWALALIGLTPFILWTGFLALIGSLSGMVGGVQGLVILALALLSGRLLLRLTGRPALVAIFQAVWLYMLILPQGVLFNV